MSFQSLAFYPFAAMVWCLWALAPAKARPGLLLAASLGFYASFGRPWLLVVLAAAALIAWGAGLLLVEPARAGRGAWLSVALGLLLALLLGVHAVARQGGGDLWLATVGVSYFTLQAAAYVVDVYLGEPREPSLGRLALYLAWFPKMVQGPFEKRSSFLQALDASVVQGPRVAELREGLSLLVWGLFKKLVIADRAAAVVDATFSRLGEASGPQLWAAAYAFVVQFIADFSGYTDMARGVSLLFGLRLGRNFDAPFLSASIAEFWQRWHQSFARWIKDYLFLPLQMALRSWGRWASPAALIIGFALVGLWHGTGLGYLLFYVIQALWLSLAIFWKPGQKRLWKLLGLDRSWVQMSFRVLVVFHCIAFSFLLFRAADWGMVRALGPAALRGWELGRIWPAFWQGLQGGQAPLDLAVVLLGALAMSISGIFGRNLSLGGLPAWGRWPIYAMLTLGLLFFGQFFGSGAFLYAKF